jgi:phosphotriesterase-related protein
MPIHTVLGPITPDQLGLTSMHEHLYLDARCLYTPPAEPPPDGDRVSMRNLGYLRWNSQGVSDNLIVDDTDVIEAGLTEFYAAGGRGLVDMTNIGLGRQVSRLPALAKATGVHVMVGCGWYRDPSHPPTIATATADELAESICAELTSGVADTGILPALIGEVGTSAPVTAAEKKVLAAAAIASCAMGAAINIHVEPNGRHGVEIVEILLAEGAEADRIILSHLDERMDLGYHLELADMGVVLEYDTFGMESYWDFPAKDPTDHERFEHVAELVARGLASRLTLGCDVYCKTGHSAYGGMGYEHLPKRVAPVLKSHYGISDRDIEQMLVTTPRRLLNRP